MLIAPLPHLLHPMVGPAAHLVIRGEEDDLIAIAASLHPCRAMPGAAISTAFGSACSLPTLQWLPRARRAFDEEDSEEGAATAVVAIGAAAAAAVGVEVATVRLLDAPWPGISRSRTSRVSLSSTISFVPMAVGRRPMLLESKIGARSPSLWRAPNHRETDYCTTASRQERRGSSFLCRNPT